MPHECTNCGRTFEDGSKEMLAGCPECGGNKFQFRPAGIVVDDGSGSEADAPATKSTDTTEPADATKPTDSTTPADTTKPTGASTSTDSSTPGESPTSNPTDESTGGPARRPGSANAVEIEASTESTPDGSSNRGASPADEDSSNVAAEASGTPTAPEDRAQANARSDVVSPDELPKRAPKERDGAERVIEPETDERPGIDDLREELNDQFESIKIVRPGEYELNLMELYDRQEYIISLQEDGRYVIEVPDAWSRDEEDE